MTDWIADPDSRRDTVRLIFRCVSDFLLDEGSVLAARHQGDFVRAVVWLALQQAGGEEAERGISVRALARSLNIPFETTRRKVRDLEADGLCRLADDQRPMAIQDDPETIVAEAARLCRAFQALQARLAELGAGPELFLAGPAPPPLNDQSTPSLTAHRLILGFILRALEAGVRPHGSLLNAIIFSALISANAQPITNDPRLARRYSAADTPPPDDLRKPARAAEIADRLRLPYELVRRRLVAFHGRGWCAAAGSGGYLGSLDRMQDPEVLESLLTISQRYGQLVQAVAQTGLVLDQAGASDRGSGG